MCYLAKARYAVRRTSGQSAARQASCVSHSSHEWAGDNAAPSWRDHKKTDGEGSDDEGTSQRDSSSEPEVLDDNDAATKFYKILDGDINLIIVRRGGKDTLFIYEESQGMYLEDYNHFKLISLAAHHKEDLACINSKGEVTASGNYGGSAPAKKRMISELMPMVRRVPTFFEDHYDATIGKLLFSNGIFDMATQTMSPFDRSLVFCDRIDRPYNPSPDPEAVEKVRNLLFVAPYTPEQILEGVPRYVATAAARMLAGDYRDRTSFWMLGDTATSKGLLTRAMQRSCGGYIGDFDAAALQGGGRRIGAAKGLSWLKPIAFKRGAISNEMQHSDVINGALFKNMVSGGDIMTVRSCGRDEEGVTVRCICMFCANDMPRINPCDSAVQDRIDGVVYNRISFVKEEDLQPGNPLQKLRDPRASALFCDPVYQDAFLHILLEAYRDYVNAGCRHAAPPSVLKGKAEWLDSAGGSLEGIIKERFDITGNEEDCVAVSVVQGYVRERRGKIDMSEKKLGIEILKISGVSSGGVKRMRLAGSETAAAQSCRIYRGMKERVFECGV